MSVSAAQSTGQPVSITIATGTLAANLASVYSISFLQSCEVAMVTVAMGVLQEDSTVANSTNRKDFARLVVNNPAVLTASAVYAISADGVTGYASTDQQLVNRIISIWPQLSFDA